MPVWRHAHVSHSPESIRPEEMGSWQQKDTTPPQQPYDPPQHQAHLPFRSTQGSDTAMNPAHPFLASPADTVVDMPREGFPQHDTDFLSSALGDQSLLTGTEINTFHDFFTMISSGGGQDLPNFEGGLNFSEHWVDSNFQHQAPEVLGYQTHASNTSVEAILSSVNFGPYLSSQQAHAPVSIPHDVFGAAQALSRPTVHSANMRSSGMHSAGIQSHHQYDGLPNTAPPMASGPSLQYPQYGNGPQRPDSAVNHQMLSNGFTPMYGPMPPALPANTRPLAHPEIHFGTDRNFTGGNFNSTETNIEGKIFQEQDAILGCLQPNTSAAPTRASSPQPNGPPAAAMTKPPLILRTTQGAVPPIKSEPDARIEPPRKRRKSKPKMSPDADDTAAFSPDALPPQPPRLVTSGSMGSIPENAVVNETSPVEEPASTGGGGKRRRGGTAAAKKPPRQNLTDEQKRENHIKSEQKRRTQIKEAFQDVEELVPDVKGASLSKSAILVQTHEFLAKLLQGNEELKQKLANAGVSPTPLQKSRED